MSDIGFSDQVPSLPEGGGGIQGIGATFSPDLSTGSGSLTVPLDAPNGPNDIGPRLGLGYSSGSGNGPFGLGFSLSLPRLVLDTSQGYPEYAGTDTILLEGAGPLVDIGGGKYRPQVDGGAWEIDVDGDGFRLTSRDGLYYTMGTTAAARIADPADTTHKYAWHLERIDDPMGNACTFTWTTDGGQLYPDTISYGAYRFVFTYEQRPDPSTFARPGFIVTTALRCTQVDLELIGDAQPLLRRWSLGYSQDPVNGTSRLQSVTLAGVDKSGVHTPAPSITFGYAALGEPDLVQLNGTGNTMLPALEFDSARRTELVDWSGNGLPDLIQVGTSGQANVWLNRGDLTLQGPHRVGTLPGFATPDASIAFADMDGDGIADLFRFDRPLSGYVPRTGGGGFDMPVTFQQAPSPIPSSAGVRLVDLNGDGIVDMLTSSASGLTLYYRDPNGGWSSVPQVVPEGSGPPVNLADPRTYLADMNGDGSTDIIQASGEGVTYWPYLGNGQWADAVVMDNPPDLPFNTRPDRLFVTDIDGDGVADLLYLDIDRVVYWINQSGTSFGPRQSIDFVPAATIQQPRIADMTGSGTPGLVWSSNGPLGRGTQYYYLDFVGANIPRMLNQIDNGIGLVTNVTYTTSAREAADAANHGEPWSTILPMAVPIVKTMTITDAATGNVRTSTFTYRDGRYDGMLREFAGFGQVNQEELGDASMPTLLSRSWFNVGVDPANPTAPLDMNTRLALRAIRGRMYKRERYGEDGSALEVNPYDRVEYAWTTITVPTPGGNVYTPRMLSTTRTAFERATSPASIISTTNNEWDAAGNVVDTTETATIPGNASATRTVRTMSQYAVDPTGRFQSKPFRMKQYDGLPIIGGGGGLIADQISVYDGLAEGQVGAQGLVTKRTALAITDARVTEVYGASTPDFASYNYFRRSDSQGWWVNQGIYDRTDDATGLHGSMTGPNGGTFQVVYDANKTFPAIVTDPMGNVVTAAYDYRVSRVSTVTHSSGEVYEVDFDPLARLVSRIEPGDTAALPTFAFGYDTGVVPAVQTQSTRAVSGTATTVDERSFFGGDGNAIEKRVVDETGEIVISSQVLNARGQILRDCIAFRPASDGYAVPDPSIPHTAFTYDALGRPLTRVDANGNTFTWSFSAGIVDEVDEDGKSTRRRIDPTGRLLSIEEHIDGRNVLSSYEFDVKGNLTSHTDANGNVVTTWYDSFGRVLRVQRPEQDTSTVYDAGGNPVEARTPTSTLVNRTYDAANRPVTVTQTGDGQPLIRYTYQDNGAPPPPDAGLHTNGGRCCRIDDGAGSTTFDYDSRGRAVIKRSTPTGSTQRIVTMAYRADGKLSTVVYSNGKVLTYQYNKRGLASSIPGVVDSIVYDLTGRRTSTTLSNGVTTNYAYDNLGNVTTLNHGTLLQTQLSWDPAGNLAQIISPDTNIASTFTYDDLHRLTRASTVAGDTRTYAYDDAGNITSKSDVGVYKYGENGAPATCLTTAGTGSFTYTNQGQMELTPWGTQHFNAVGQMTAITGGTTAEFTYDYAGSRVSSTFTQGAVSNTRLTPDALYAIEDGQLVLYLFDGEMLVAHEVDGGARTYLHHDHIGSLVLMTDAAGAVADAIRYDAFGQVLFRQSAGSDVPIGFAQGTFDAPSGLLYLDARYYHPRLGRFVSPDSLVQSVYVPVAWNTYAYCANNPQRFVDPTGRAWWQVLLCVLAIVALVALTIVTCGIAAPAAGVGAAAAATAAGATAAAAATASTVAIASIYVAVGLGLVAGGIIGGVAAYEAGGSGFDIFLGALCGAAVGGWAALGGQAASSAIMGAVATHSLLAADILAGAAAGAINGAAMGFAAGFAGGKGTLDGILHDMLLGVIAGAVVGGAFGGLNYALTSGAAPTFPKTGPGQGPNMPESPGSSSGGLNPGTLGNTTTSSIPGALTKAASPYLSYAGQVAGRALLMSPFAMAAEVLIIDAGVGVLDLGFGPQIFAWLKQHNVSI